MLFPAVSVKDCASPNPVQPQTELLVPWALVSKAQRGARLLLSGSLTGKSDKQGCGGSQKPPGPAFPASRGRALAAGCSGGEAVSAESWGWATPATSKCLQKKRKNKISKIRTSQWPAETADLPLCVPMGPIGLLKQRVPDAASLHMVVLTLALQSCQERFTSPCSCLARRAAF